MQYINCRAYKPIDPFPKREGDRWHILRGEIYLRVTPGLVETYYLLRERAYTGEKPTV